MGAGHTGRSMELNKLPVCDETNSLYELQEYGENRIAVQAENFSLEQICCSGQCFRMKRIKENHFSVISGDRYLEAEQHGKTVIFHCGKEEFFDYWEDYFDLKTDYKTWISGINPNDGYLRKAARTAWGVRILRQDLWEMIVTFLISQQNHIKRISRSIELLCRTYGKECISAKGTVYYGFPAPGTLCGLPEDALMECNLGYRSKYVVRTAGAVVSGETDLRKIEKMSYKDARTELLKCFGVGEKVADCICLFALHKLEAFPVDTHIRQALDAHYKRGFPNRRYKECRGVMQQYIFYYELHGQM